ncbi:GNAT family N-acetyltransferase [Aestuariispira insulae]|uniref:GNAT family N-acetyltransferase n=1 Tax=Aestuariispira insulae TaxID=1461337 RepID=UPI0015F26BC3|nr:GNAT family N-acetyltransferase [Aestuariispira insulae]
MDQIIDLAEKWQALESRADPKFMLSWTWICCWLKQVGNDAFLLEGKLGDETVLLGLLARHEEHRHGFVRARQLHLHATGLPDKDQICIEYNGFLTGQNMRPQLLTAAVDYLRRDAETKKILGTWDELVIRNAPAPDRVAFQHTGLPQRVIALDRCYATDLAAIREQGKSFLDSLSKNSRAQIRKSMRLYEERGALCLERAKSAQEAKQWFWDLAPLHEARWLEKAHNHRPAHQNDAFTGFHEDLIDECWPLGQIEMVRIRCGDKAIGYLYNFLYRDRVYFYLSALSYDNNPRIKPGMVCHALCIQDHLEKGAVIYDFMAGDQRYKASLGEVSEDFASIALQQPRVTLTLERWLTSFKHWIIRQSR